MESTPAQPGPSGCDSYSWSNVKKHCGNCRALVSSSANGGICQNFCKENGLNCVKVEEDQGNSCTNINHSQSTEMSCYTDVKEYGAGKDYICNCGNQSPPDKIIPQPDNQGKFLRLPLSYK